jgi:hypothetical protein
MEAPAILLTSDLLVPARELMEKIRSLVQNHLIFCQGSTTGPLLV